MGAMKRLHDDLEHGSVLVTAGEFSDGETVYGLIEITTPLGYIRISGRELLARFVDIDDIATDDLEAFPGVDELEPPPSVVITHNDEVVRPRMTPNGAAPKAVTGGGSVRPASNRVANANKSKPVNKIGGYEK